MRSFSHCIPTALHSFEGGDLMSHPSWTISWDVDDVLSTSISLSLSISLSHSLEDDGSAEWLLDQQSTLSTIQEHRRGQRTKNHHRRQERQVCCSFVYFQLRQADTENFRANDDSLTYTHCQSYLSFSLASVHWLWRYQHIDSARENNTDQPATGHCRSLALSRHTKTHNDGHRLSSSSSFATTTVAATRAKARANDTRCLRSPSSMTAQ